MTKTERAELRRLVQLRAEADELQRRVDDLRAFEREYRARLRAYLQGCLERLDGECAR